MGNCAGRDAKGLPAPGVARHERYPPPMRSTKNIRFSICLVAASLFLALLGSPPRASAEDDPALQPLADFEKVAGAVLVLAKDLGFVPRYKQLAATVAETHDLDRMLAMRLGNVADDLDATQRKTLKNLLFKRLVATYAMAFDGRAGKTLERGEVVATDGGVRRVELRLEGDGAPRLIRMDVGPGAGGARILAVVWPDVDSAAVEQAANARVLKAGGFEALQKDWNGRVPLPERKEEASAKTPREVVESLQVALIDVMKRASSLGYQGRYDTLLPIVDATHDLSSIARLTLRRHWKSLSPAQQKRFAERFRVFSVARYAGRFDGYSGESFAFVGEEKARSMDVIRSNLVKSDGKKIPFVFQLRTTSKGTPRILNITADGVSDPCEYGQCHSPAGGGGTYAAQDCAGRNVRGCFSESIPG